MRMVHDEVAEDDYTALRLSRAAPGRMVVLCEGFKGSLFYVCLECGFASPIRTSPHKTPRKRDCKGRLERFALGHEFTTDVVLADFFIPIPAEVADEYSFAQSLAYALVEGAASTLSVPSRNLDVTIHPGSPSRLPSIVLYDSVPGGAGLVAQLADRAILDRCLTEARDRVDGRCGCGELQSCYGCLRSYRNQFAHRNLMRGPVFTYLNRVIGEMS
jgi:hypothetical protein